MGLTSKQDHFARLIALDGVNQSDAYRQSYNAGNMLPATVNRKAHDLANNGKVTARVLELREPLEAQAVVNVNEILEELKKVGFAATKAPRASDKIAALDKMAKIVGAYRDDRQDNKLAPVTHVTVILATGSETREIAPRTVDRELLPGDDDERQ